MVSPVSGSGSVYPSSDTNNYTDFKNAVHQFLANPTPAHYQAVQECAGKLQQPVPIAVSQILDQCQLVEVLSSLPPHPLNDSNRQEIYDTEIMIKNELDELPK